MPKVVSQQYLGNGNQRMVARFEDGTWQEAIIPRGVNPPDANWTEITEPRDPAEFGEYIYERGQSWAFAVYMLIMAGFFVLGYLIYTGAMSWAVAEFLGGAAGLLMLGYFAYVARGPNWYRE